MIKVQHFFTTYCLYSNTGFLSDLQFATAEFFTHFETSIHGSLQVPLQAPTKITEHSRASWQNNVLQRRQTEKQPLVKLDLWNEAWFLRRFSNPQNFRFTDLFYDNHYNLFKYKANYLNVHSNVLAWYWGHGAILFLNFTSREHSGLNLIIFIVLLVRGLD